MRNVILMFLLCPVMLYAQTTGRFTDPRDGKVYQTVKIGNQIWMAENLNYDIGEGCYCYENDSANCEKYGRLYTWETAKKTPPKGWHLPSRKEFEVLLKNLGGETGKVYPQIIPGGSSGFNAYLGGWRSVGGYFGGLGKDANFWSSSDGDDISAWGISVKNDNQTAEMIFGTKVTAFSVRLIKD